MFNFLKAIFALFCLFVYKHLMLWIGYAVIYWITDGEVGLFFLGTLFYTIIYIICFYLMHSQNDSSSYTIKGEIIASEKGGDLLIVKIDAKSMSRDTLNLMIDDENEFNGYTAIDYSGVIFTSKLNAFKFYNNWIKYAKVPCVITGSKEKDIKKYITSASYTVYRINKMCESNNKTELWKVKIDKSKIGYSGISRITMLELKYNGWMSKDYTCLYFEDLKDALKFCGEVCDWASPPELIETHEPLESLINSVDYYIKKKSESKKI